MSPKRSLVLVVLVVLFMLALYWNDQSQKVENTVSVNPDASARVQPALQENFTQSENTPPPSVEVSKKMAEESEAVSSEIEKTFSNNLKSIVTCLGGDPKGVGDAAEPNLTSMLEALKPVVGDNVVYMDDWNEVVMDYSDGTKKKFRTEVSYEDVNNPTKYLMVYKLSPDGPPTMEDLDSTKTTNPSDDFVQYLKAGSSLEIEEKGGRVYFQNGEEMITVERDGKLESINMEVKTNNAVRTVTCSDLNSVNGGCTCE